MIPMATATETPTEYIQHHLTFLTHPVAPGSFWTINVDTLVMTALLGLVTFGFLYFVTRRATAGVPSKTQAFVEWFLDFVNGQVKSVYTGTTKLIAPYIIGISQRCARSSISSPSPPKLIRNSMPTTLISA